MAESWWEYVQRISGGASQSEIARKMNLGVSSVGRWSFGSEPTPQNVRGFAEAYGRPVTEAFIAAGYLTSDDLDGGQKRTSGTQFDDPYEQEIWDAPGALSDDERWALIAYLRSYRQLREHHD